MKLATPVLLIGVFLLVSLAACTNNEDESRNRAKLMRAESMLEIQNAISRCAMAWDRENTEDFQNIFIKDAVIIDSWHKKEISRYNSVKEFMDARGDEGGNVGGHTLSLVYFKKLNNKTASTEVIFNYFWYGSYINNTPPVNIRGSYIDEWVNTDDGWRIAKRTIEHESVPLHRAEKYGMSD